MEKEMFIHALIFCVSILVIMRSFKRTHPKYSYCPDNAAGDLLGRYNRHQGAMAVQSALQQENGYFAQEQAVALTAAGINSIDDNGSEVKLSPEHETFTRLSIHLDQASTGCFTHSVRCVCLGDRSPPHSKASDPAGLLKQYA